MRYIGIKGGETLPETICWTCKKACGGCDWSRSGSAAGHNRKVRPVEGWTALRRDVGEFNGSRMRMVESYIVIECPLYEEEKRG